MALNEVNRKNPAVRRILQEIKEIQSDTSGDLMAEALESDIFEWHFAVRGPPGTDFEGGIYHGRILLPAEYPFKPPSFIMLTPSGRFQTNMQICLSISAHHPEHWQPSWSVRTALTALIAFMPSPGAGALGSLDYTGEERRKLAVKARSDPPKWGSPERQRIINDMHARMLAAGPSTSIPTAPAPPVPAQDNPAAGIATQPGGTEEAASTPHAGTPTSQVSGSPHPFAPSPGAQASTPVTPLPSGSADSGPGGVQQVNGAGSSAPIQATSPDHPAPSTAQVPAAAVTGVVRPVGAESSVRAHTQPPRAQLQQAAHHPADTWGLTILAVALGILIAAILLRKALVAAGYPIPPLADTLRSAHATQAHNGL